MTTQHSPILSVYVAGKVEQNADRVAEWRLGLVSPSWDEGTTPKDMCKAVYKVEGVEWRYAGPVFESMHTWVHNWEDRDMIFKRNMAAIRNCDMFFAFIDSDDCFGTIAEIGLAYALHKSIYIAYGRDLRYKIRDYWFVSHCAVSTDLCDNIVHLRLAFKHSLENEALRVRRVHESAEIQALIRHPGP